jgi:hypothetical protein
MLSDLGVLTADKDTLCRYVEYVCVNLVPGLLEYVRA